MPVTDSTAVKFSNEKIRPAADKLAQAYYTAVMVRDEWYANNLGAVLPVGGGVIADGADVDGRNILTADDARLLINRCEDLITDYEATNKAKLNTVLKPAVNVRP